MISAPAGQRTRFVQALEALRKNIRGGGLIMDSVDPEIYNIPRNLDIFPTALGSYQQSTQALELPLHYTLNQLKGMFQRSNREEDHIESIFVSSAEYCKQIGDAKHEFLLLEVKDERIPQISNWVLLDRTVSVSTSSNFTAVSTSVSSSSPAQDRLRVSCYGKKDLLIKQCSLGPYYVLERVTLPSSASSKPLMLWELVILAIETSSSRLMYNLMSAQCFWFASCLWESMRRLVAGAYHEQIVADNSRGKFGHFFQQDVDRFEVEEILYKTKSEFGQFRRELARGKEQQLVGRAQFPVSESISYYKKEYDKVIMELERLEQAVASNTTASTTTSHGDLGVNSGRVPYVENENETLGGQLERLDHTTTGAASTPAIEDLGKRRKESSRLEQEHESLAWEHEGLLTSAAGLEQLTGDTAVSNFQNLHEAGIRRNSVNPEVYNIPRNLHIFPSGLGSYTHGKRELEDPRLYTLSHFKSLLLQSSTQHDHVENIYVSSVEYCKQLGQATHEFLLLEVRDKLIPKLSNFVVLERTVHKPTSGALTTLYSSPCVDIPAQDRLRLSCYGEKDLLIKQCTLGPYQVLERAELHSSSPSAPLLLWELAILALETSKSRLMYNLLKAQCFWFAGCIWECMLKLRPELNRTTVTTNKNRGKFKIFQQKVNSREIDVILEKTKSGIQQCQEELNTKKAAAECRNSLDPENERLRRELEETKRQLQQMVLNVVNYSLWDRRRGSVTESGTIVFHLIASNPSKFR
ncbi:hypothetical protein BDV93DRAFT_581129 [Ceratobasidium sp. AG-I]|nr:hypothetical protein BDV93DRAFT_581129 [Ceratobasidium sp. AG-I]